jgi:hypothetical protein
MHCCTELAHAARAGDYTRYMDLSHEYAHMLCRNTTCGPTLRDAAEGGNLDIIATFSPDWDTILYDACGYGHVALVRAALEHVNHTSDLTWVSRTNAWHAGYLDIVELFPDVPTNPAFDVYKLQTSCDRLKPNTTIASIDALIARKQVTADRIFRRVCINGTMSLITHMVNTYTVSYTQGLFGACEGEHADVARYMMTLLNITTYEWNFAASWYISDLATLKFMLETHPTAPSINDLNYVFTYALHNDAVCILEYLETELGYTRSIGSIIDAICSLFDSRQFDYEACAVKYLFKKYPDIPYEPFLTRAVPRILHDIIIDGCPNGWMQLFENGLNTPTPAIVVRMVKTYQHIPKLTFSGVEGALCVKALLELGYADWSRIIIRPCLVHTLIDVGAPLERHMDGMPNAIKEEYARLRCIRNIRATLINYLRICPHVLTNLILDYAPYS